MSHERHSLAGRIGAEIRAVTDEGANENDTRPSTASLVNKITCAQTGRVTEPGRYVSGLDGLRNGGRSRRPAALGQSYCPRQ
jgi:hypothetical protein